MNGATVVRPALLGIAIGRRGSLYVWVRWGTDLFETGRLERPVSRETTLAGRPTERRCGRGGAAEVRAVCEAVGRPVNVLAHRGLTMAAVVDAGAQRISVGGSLAWTAIEAMAGGAEAMRDQGDFSALAGPARIKGWLGAEPPST